MFGTLVGDTFSDIRSEAVGGTGEPTRLSAAAGAPVAAVGFQDGSVVIFDHGARQEFKAGAPLRDIVVSGDGKYLVAIVSGPQATTVVRDVANGQTVLELRDWISGAAFDPASQTLLLGSDPRGELILYDLRRMREQGRWLAHSGGVRVVAFNADGTSIYSAGNGGDVRSWSMKALADLRDAAPHKLRKALERSTGLMLAPDGKVRSRTGLPPSLEQTAQYAVVTPDDAADVVASRAAIAVEDGDPGRLVAACGKLGDADHVAPSQTDLGLLVAAAMCADAAGHADAAKARYREFYEAAEAQGNSPGQLAVTPALVRGSGANLKRSIVSGDKGELSAALRLVDLVYLSSWRDGSLIRLPPSELLGDYDQAIEDVSGLATLRAIDQRANEFVDGLGPGWLEQAKSAAEAGAVPRLLFNVGVAHASRDDVPGAYDMILRAAGLAAKVVGNLEMAGDPSATEARQAWVQALAGSASLACQAAAQARDAKEDAVNGHSIGDLLTQAGESRAQAAEQWKILGERHAQDDDTTRSINTLRAILLGCAIRPKR